MVSAIPRISSRAPYRRRAAAALIAVVALVASACSGSAATSAPPASAAAPSAAAPSAAAGASAPILANLSGSERTRVSGLIAKAQSEGALAWIDSIPVPATAQAMFAAFQQEYGLPNLKLNYQRLSTSKIASLLEQEVTAGKITTDIAGAAFPDMWSQLKSSNALLQYTSPEASNYTASAQYLSNDPGYWISADAFGQVPVVNTKVYPAPITSWQDLLNPALKGKIYWINPDASSSMLYTYIALRSVLPLSYFQKLAGQVGGFSTGSSVKDVQAVTTGEDTMAITVDFRPLQFANTGVPMKSYYPKEGVLMLGQSYGIMANSPDPAAAELFEDFLLSTQGQQLYVNKEGVTPARSGITMSSTIQQYSPQSVTDVTLLKFDWNTPAATLTKYKNEFNQVFHR